MTQVYLSYSRACSVVCARCPCVISSCVGECLGCLQDHLSRTVDFSVFSSRPNSLCEALFQLHKNGNIIVWVLLCLVSNVNILRFTCAVLLHVISVPYLCQHPNPHVCSILETLGLFAGVKHELSGVSLCVFPSSVSIYDLFMSRIAGPHRDFNEITNGQF